MDERNVRRGDKLPKPEVGGDFSQGSSGGLALPCDDILRPSDQYYGEERQSLWTEWEDRLLVHLVEKYGARKWQTKAKVFENRLGKHLRDRWVNHLDPHLKKADWTDAEDWVLFLFQRKSGCANKWSHIAQSLPGRTDNNVKNRWNSTMKKKRHFLESKLAQMIEASGQTAPAQDFATEAEANLFRQYLDEIMCQSEHQQPRSDAKLFSDDVSSQRGMAY